MKKNRKYSSKKEYVGRISRSKGLYDLESKGNKKISHRILRAKDKKELHKEINAPKVIVQIIESERGWGMKVDETKEFDTLAEAQSFCEKFNQTNVDNWNKTHEVPDWYMQARIVGGGV